MTFPINWARLWMKGFRYFISFNPHNYPRRKAVIICIVQMKKWRCWRMKTQGHITDEQKWQSVRLGTWRLTSGLLPPQGKPRALLARREHPVRKCDAGRPIAVTASLTYGTLSTGKPKVSLSKTALAEVWIWPQSVHGALRNWVR